jgi:hypothetical protein
MITYTMDNTFDDLRQLIAKIKQDEGRKNSMKSYIEAHIGSLHKAISINTATPEITLLEFSIAYIDSAPEYLDAIHTLALESNTNNYVKPFVGLALMYFIKPPELLLQYNGSQRLLYQAYLSNRLLEELNDQITGISAIPLSPLDISMDNIICHALIGDELANQLDHLVLLTIETTVSDKSVFEQPQTQQFLKQQSQNKWKHTKQRWPCFNNDLSINLNIGGY